MASVRLIRLRKIFPGRKGREVTAVRDLSLDIPDGEFLVLVGPSGCGKSTTLRLIAGLEDVTQGSIIIDDQDVTRIAPKDRDLAMVFQNYALFPHMTVRENIGFGLKLRRFRRAEIQQRVEEVAVTLGLTHCLDRKPGAISGGQRQRVALGRAIVRQPKVFLFDEPLSNLDAGMRLEMRAELLRLHRRLKATMIFVTHDQAEAMTMGDRIAVMRDGDLLQVEKPMTIYRGPANRFVAGFLGSPPMNFIQGVLRSGAEGYLLQANRSPDAERNEPWAMSIDRLPCASWKKWLDRELVIGIRPEDVRVVSMGADSKGIARVEWIEALGAETHLHLNASGQRLVARVRESVPYHSDDEVSVTWDDGALHGFDPASGSRLAP